MTGSLAAKITTSVMLPKGHALVDFEMHSAINPDNKCHAKECAVGHALFHVTEKLEDRCAARVKAHYSSCNVLVHAHEGKDCDELFKLRMVADQCHAPLLVLHTDPELLQCYRAKEEEA